MSLDKDIREIASQADMDQSAAGLSNFARMSGEYFRDLKEAGFSVSQAFEMTKQWQLALLTAGLNQQRNTGGQ
jgi:hypothetical protein